MKCIAKKKPSCAVELIVDQIGEIYELHYLDCYWWHPRLAR